MSSSVPAATHRPAWIIEHPHERLAAIVARGRGGLAEPSAGEPRPGLCAPVWLTGSLAAGRCRFRVTAESPLVEGLAALLCELYDGEPAEEVAALEPGLFDELGLSRQLPPTRLNGLANVRRVIREFAQSVVAS